MTTMRGDIVNRVKRLPKPSLAAEALQPVFEAVSNSLHAVEDAFGEQYQDRGAITVTIRNPRAPDDIEIIVDDNGVGLEPVRSESFTPQNGYDTRS
ncbi:anti-sigma regulatory factor (Ser/Thr protein kinase) [Parvibaculum indicum]|uniref:ATP-binding protein n=1 Tax=Parvibaculum indicum TaxID=562969 RepID=UPI0014228B25|nr:ATP-binding protein [Parvibaculum indicum]NIJ42083.1 anti-sigma regulatory factor (Ser/Thr protein kinase) [Parvibaculum indicum]